MIPVKVGLLNPSTGKDVLPEGTTVLRFVEAEQTFIFEGIEEKPIASVLRGFSAPVRLQFNPVQTDEELTFMMAHDSDSFNKWDAGNKFQIMLLLSQIKAITTDSDLPPLPESFISAMRQVISSCASGVADPSLIAYAMQLPDGTTLSQEVYVIDPDAIHAAIKHTKKSLAIALKAELQTVYDSLTGSGPYEFSASEVGRRRLRNTCLDYLSAADSVEDAAERAMGQFKTANCMSDKLAALSALVDLPMASPERSKALSAFYEDAKGDALVLNKWFAIQASASVDKLLDLVQDLKKHPDFTMTNPNRCRSLVQVFAGSKHFHATDGAGYAFLADNIIELDVEINNPQVAARMAGVFSRWRKYGPERQILMKAQLERIKNTPGLSKDTLEVVSRSLK
jgi:aminopeptidase N